VVTLANEHIKSQQKAFIDKENKAKMSLQD